jgi:MerR family transcriptional regulator, copper efflux regulator
MTNQGFNINEAAKQLNVSTRTIRRYIKAGKIKADLIKGSFGDEYRILELPPQFDPNQMPDEATISENEKTLDRPTDQIAFSGIDLIRELQEKNLALAAQLGAAAERIRAMEGQLKLLAPPKNPETTHGQAEASKETWWRRIIPRFQERNHL